MSFLFKSRPKSPADLAKALKQQLGANGLEVGRLLSQCRQQLEVSVSESLYHLLIELNAQGVPMALITQLGNLEFETRKEAVLLFNQLISCPLGHRHPIADHLESTPVALGHLINK